MKRFFFLLVFVVGSSLFLQAQQSSKPYNWKDVDSLIHKQYYSQAYGLTQQLLQRAVSEKNSRQCLVAANYSFMTANRFMEYSIDSALNLFQRIMPALDPVDKAIANLLVADIYANYNASNRYVIRNNSPSNEKTLDFKLWDADRFRDTVASLIYDALKDKELLLNTPSKSLDYITEMREGKDGDLTPTLFDIMLLKAVDIFEMLGYDRLISNDFEKVSQLYGIADIFTSMPAPRPANEKRAFAAFLLQCVQAREASHLKHYGSTNIMIELFLERFETIGMLTNCDVKKDYEKAIIDAINHYRYSNSDHLTLLYYALANYQYNQARYVDAMAVIDSAMTIAPKSTGAIKCYNLKLNIEKSVITTIVDNPVPSGHEQLAIANARNVDHLYFRVIKYVDYYKKLSYDERRNYLLKQKVVKQWDKAIDKQVDYQSHLNYFIIPSLNQGKYILLIAPDAEFRDDGIAIVSFDVCDIALLPAKESSNHQRGFAVNRTTGKPVEGCEISLYYKKNYDGSRHKLTTLKTDKDGYYDFTPHLQQIEKSYYNVEYVLKYKGTEITTFSYGFDKEIEKHNTEQNYYLYLDQPVYKPGDTVRFSCLGTAENDYDGYIMAYDTVIFKLLGVNDEVVDTVQLVSDRFGVCEGSFALPLDAMPGYWEIRFNEKYMRFKVEAYKQPKFTVSLSLPKESRSFNQKAHFEGVAASYSAVPISNAKVSYTITREEISPYWWWGWRSWWRPCESKVVASGETTTDEKGFFSVEFIPTPDSSVSASRRPAFTYELNATVTDINGESHTASESMSVGYINNYLRLSEQHASLDSVKVSVSKHNLDGTSVNGNIQLQVSKLQTPKQPRLSHEMIDHVDNLGPINAKTLSDYQKLYPLFDCDGYANDYTRWPVERTLFERTVSTTPEHPYVFDFAGMEAAIYKVVATELTDMGDTLRSEEYVVYEPSSTPSPVLSDLLSAYVENESVEIGGNAVIRVGSPYENQPVILFVNGKRYRQHSILTLKKGYNKIVIPVSDTLLGGFKVELAAIRENHFESKAFSIDVPFSHKELTVEFNTFRNKLQPGDKEQWSILVKETKNNAPATANLLMTMYDHALDTYGSLSWHQRFWWQHYYSTVFHSPSDMNTGYYNFAPTLHQEGYRDYQYSYRYFNSYLYRNRYYRNGKVPVIEIGTAESGARLSSDYVERKSAKTVDVVAAVAGVGYSDGLVSSSARGEDALEEIEYELSVDFDESINIQSNDASIAAQRPKSDKEPEVKVRQNLHTLAFFRPTMRTNSQGEVELAFTVPDLLTEWSIRGFAWTKDLKVGSVSASAVTQKRLMVVPNVPRFLRHGDTCIFSVKVSNMSGQSQPVEVSLSMTDGATQLPLSMVVGESSKSITLADGASGEVSFLLAVPREAVFVANYKVVARGKGCSDGEQAPIPLLPSRQLVTESMAFYINGAGVKHYNMKHLTTLNPKATGFSLVHHALTVDLTPNPVWLAIQSLPYVSRQQNPSNIYLANEIYTNSLAAAIVDNNPQIEQMFNDWKANEPDAFQSALDRNTDIKQTVMTETPWLRDARNEEQQHLDIARYFNSRSINQQLQADLSKLIKAQRSDGGWSWIEGGRWSSLYTTQYILKTFGLLQQQGVELDSRTIRALNDAMDYVDQENYTYYKKFIKGKGYDVVNLDYLYLRSMYPDNKLSKGQKEAYDFFYNNAKKYNKEYRSLFSQSLLSLVFFRNGDTELAKEMATRIREKALYSDEMGMYWRDNTSSWLWSERPIETQALLIRTFAEVLNDSESVARMQQWLLKQKQTTNWSSDVSTINAIQALLIAPGNEEQSPVRMQPSLMSVDYGSHHLQTDTSRFQLHVSQRLEGSQITPADGKVTIRKEDNGIAWGALYWQYFENVEKIPASSMGITLKQTLYRVENDNRMTAVKGDVKLHVGDKVRVRIEIKSDRNLEYLELKAPRCAAFEPVSTASGWRWNSGLSYYAAVTNAALTLYIDRIDKGDYVVEFDLFVNNAGTYNTAPTTMQCLYAPEFRALCPVPQIKVLP